jgi:hypothetical protein
MTTAACGSFLAGCALLFVSTDGLAGGPGGLVDASAAEGGGGLDSASALDGGDGTANADSGTDASPLAFCSSNPGHTFCDDFDDRADAKVGWETDFGGRSLGSTDVTRSSSPPRSFRSETTAGLIVASYSHISRTFGTTNRVRAAFDIFVTPPSGSVGDSLGTLNFPQGNLDIVWYTSGTFALAERPAGKPNIDHNSAIPLPSGKWVRVQIECTPGRIVLSVDGALAFDATTVVTYQGSPGLSLGLYSEDTFAIAANYDNVLVDTSF